jgi:hypothetical protein
VREQISIVWASKLLLIYYGSRRNFTQTFHNWWLIYVFLCLFMFFFFSLQILWEQRVYLSLMFTITCLILCC